MKTAILSFRVTNYRFICKGRKKIRELEIRTQKICFLNLKVQSSSCTPPAPAITR